MPKTQVQPNAETRREHLIAILYTTLAERNRKPQVRDLEILADALISSDLIQTERLGHPETP